MYKEYKTVIDGLIWAGFLVLIIFMRALVDGSKEDAHQVIDVLFGVYMFFAVLAIGEKIYKKIRRPFLKK